MKSQSAVTPVTTPGTFVPDSTAKKSPFHAGEQAVQSRLGVRAVIEPWARQVVRPYLTDEHRAFFAQLPFVVAAARDSSGRPWATILAGAPGFIEAADAASLRFAARPQPGDALHEGLQAGAELGLLGIELESRRRNRVNGEITDSAPTGFTLRVGQAFGNCPQYITERAWRRTAQPVPAPRTTRSDSLDDHAQRQIATADTVFIASGYGVTDDRDETLGMDASHRGGAPGFVKVLGASRVVLPDYAGNNHFNTLGNLELDPRVGLLFVDFETGGMLQLSGTAAIDWDSAAIKRYAGAQRLVVIDIEQVVRLDQALPLRWTSPDHQPQPLRVMKKTRHSEDVMSLELAAVDGGSLAPFAAGQHLPISVQVEGFPEPLSRTYSLSDAPHREHYRISVKRVPGGSVSHFLHDNVEVGAVIEAHRPGGSFVVADSPRPIALVSAGIGITPMVSMLGALSAPHERRPVYFVHAARDGAHHPLAAQVRELALQREGVRLHTAYSRPRVQDIGAATDVQHGHINIDTLSALIPGLEADFYLCGPPGFLADLSAGLLDRGVDAVRIFTESF